MTKGTGVLIPVRNREVPDLAALPHELVHALVGRSPSQVLNEGLAVHVDARLRLAGPIWPAYELGLHRWVSAMAEHRGGLGLEQLLATPTIRFRGGDDTRAVTAFYLQAGSYVEFLVDHFGVSRFWPMFRAGEPIPSGWCVPCLERAWEDALGGPLDVEERRRWEVAEARIDRVKLAARCDDAAGAGR